MANVATWSNFLVSRCVCNRQ